MSPKLKILVLVLLCTLPLVLFVLVITYNQFRSAQNIKLQELESITKLGASEQKQITEGARQLLITLSSTDAVASPSSPKCSEFLSSLRAQYVRYLNFGVIDSNRQVKCAADLDQAKQNPPYQDLIDQTLATGDFAIGSYYKIMGDGAVLNFGYPLGGKQIVYASLSLDWVSDFVSSLSTPQDLVINILDRDGTVLARRPAITKATGQSFVTTPVIQHILSEGSGTTIKTGIDNVTRLYAFTAIDKNQQTYIAAGLPQKVIYKDVTHTFVLSIIALLFILALSIIVSLKIGDVLIIKQIESEHKLDHLKDDFISLASHQLRSPMTAIRWLSENLLETNLSGPQKSVVNKIHDSTIRIIHLTSTLLNISRLETGSLTTRTKQLSFAKIITPIIAELKVLSAARHLKIITVYAANLSITTDPNLLSEALAVLLSNAVKYATSKSTIKLLAKRTSSSIIIKVQNTGIGIAVADLSHLFTRFYRTSAGKLTSPDGSGLGLYLAKLIAMRLGGDLDLSNHSPKSTIFILTLPNEVR